MAASRAIHNGENFLKNKRTMVVGISLGNPYFHKRENLRRLFKWARSNSEKILLFLTDEISVHNYRAIGSKNPKKSARVNANSLRNKCNDAIKETGLCNMSYCYVNWTDEVEASCEYRKAFSHVNNLYQANDQFHSDVRNRTQAALKCLRNSREKGGDGKKGDEREVEVDVEEGVLYFLKETAFFSAVRNIYEDCEEFVYVYHRACPVIEKFFNGCYDDIVKSYFGLFIFQNEEI